MPPQDPKVVEAQRLKSKLLEIEMQLKDQRKINGRLREAMEKKNRLIAIVEEKTAGEMERFRWKKNSKLHEHSIVQEESDRKLRHLKDAENAIKNEIAGYDIMEYENALLNERLKQISTQQLATEQLQVSERESKQQKNFDTRMALEEILRKTISNFDNDYRDEAIEKMMGEAANADAENMRIYKEFDIREKKTGDLIRQQQLSYDLLLKTKIEKDVVQASAHIQEETVDKLKKANEKRSSEIEARRLGLNYFERDIKDIKQRTKAVLIALQELSVSQKAVTDIKFKRKEATIKVIRMCRVMQQEGLLVLDKNRKHQSSMISAQMGSIAVADPTAMNAETSASVQASDDEFDDCAIVRVETKLSDNSNQETDEDMQRAMMSSRHSLQYSDDGQMNTADSPASLSPDNKFLRPLSGNVEALGSSSDFGPFSPQNGDDINFSLSKLMSTAQMVQQQQQEGNPQRLQQHSKKSSYGGNKEGGGGGGGRNSYGGGSGSGSGNNLDSASEVYKTTGSSKRTSSFSMMRV